MKKISLKDVKNGLRRDEMRKVLTGGSGYTDCGGTDCHYQSCVDQSCAGGYKKYCYGTFCVDQYGLNQIQYRCGC